MFGFGTGWSPLEHDPASDRLVRWTGPLAMLRVHDGGRDVVVTIAGELTGRFERPPRVDIRSAGTLLGSFEPAAEFHWAFSVPAAVLQQGGGEIVLRTDTTFASRDQSEDGPASEGKLRRRDGRVEGP